MMHLNAQVPMFVLALSDMSHRNMLLMDIYVTLFLVLSAEHARLLDQLK